jgi:hypothetical protein
VPTLGRLAGCQNGTTRLVLTTEVEPSDRRSPKEVPGTLHSSTRRGRCGRSAHRLLVRSHLVDRQASRFAERHTRTSQVKALPPEVVSVSPARTGFPLARVLRHTASQPAGRFVDWMVQRQTCAISREVSARKGPTPPTTNRDSVTFHSDYIPPPPTSPQASARRVRPARWRGPELPGVFRADSAPPDPDYAFPQLTELRPKALRIAKTTSFRYPH